MFDFSLGELLVTGVVALVVIGPERLPKVARTLGAMLGRVQQYVSSVKADIQREVDMDALKQLDAAMREEGRQLHQSVIDGLQQPASQAENPTGHQVDGQAQAASPEFAPQPLESQPFQPPNNDKP